MLGCRAPRVVGNEHINRFHLRVPGPLCYGGVKDAYSGMKDVNQSVIALQDNLMKAQGAIKIATAELDAAKNNGQQLIRDSVAALQTAQQNLATTQTAYEGRSTAIQETMAMYARGGFWSRYAGPAPEMLGCRAPLETLAKYGIDAASGERIRKAG
jgi:hypothetical protein